MMFHASYSWIGPQLPKGCGCIGLLSFMKTKIPDSLSKKKRGQHWEFWSLVSAIEGSTFWSLVSAIDGSTLPQDCVEESYAEHKETGKTYNKMTTWLHIL